MELEVQTYDRFLVFDVLGKKSAYINDSIELPGNAKLTYTGGLVCKSVGIPETVNFILSIGSGMAVEAVAKWIYNKFKNKTEKMTINRREIIFDEGQIKKIIEEEIAIK